MCVCVGVGGSGRKVHLSSKFAITFIFPTSLTTLYSLMDNHMIPILSHMMSHDADIKPHDYIKPIIH